jgi:hypothetical protein
VISFNYLKISHGKWIPRQRNHHRKDTFSSKKKNKHDIRKETWTLKITTRGRLTGRAGEGRERE